jgi:hypothetical protein
MNLNILMAMCGERFFPHIVLVSTMWNGLPSDRAIAEAEARENELFNSFWGYMLRKGATPMRYMGSQESGQSIIKAVLAAHDVPPMSLELEVRDCCIEETAAGRLMTAEIRRREEALRQELLEEKEEEQRMKAELVQEQEEIRREELLRRERAPVNGGRLEVRPAGNTRGVVERAQSFVPASWKVTFKLSFQPFRRQR